MMELKHTSIFGIMFDSLVKINYNFDWYSTGRTVVQLYNDRISHLPLVSLLIRCQFDVGLMQRSILNQAL